MATECSKGVDGVGIATTRNFNIAYIEIRVIGNGGTAHGQTIACRSNSLPTLEDRIPRGNEQDNIKAQIFSRLFGTSQMPVMDRIEGATHDP